MAIDCGDGCGFKGLHDLVEDAGGLNTISVFGLGDLFLILFCKRPGFGGFGSGDRGNPADAGGQPLLRKQCEPTGIRGAIEVCSATEFDGHITPAVVLGVGKQFGNRSADTDHPYRVGVSLAEHCAKGLDGAGLVQRNEFRVDGEILIDTGLDLLLDGRELIGGECAGARIVEAEPVACNQ